MAGIRSDEHPLTSFSTTIDSQLASTATSALKTVAITWDRVRLATTSDQDMAALLHTIVRGFPQFRHELPTTLQEYYQFRNHLYTVDGVILYKDRIVLPPSLRPHILATLYSADQGVTSMTAQAESTIFWTGITPANASLRANCGHCNRMAPSEPSAPAFPPVPSTHPFQCICADFFTHKGMHYLVVVDRYSNWPIIERAHEGSKVLIDSLRQLFATFGIPDECATNGGPEFTAGEPLTPTPISPLPNVCLAVPSKTSSQFFLAGTSHTPLGETPKQLERRHSGTGT